MLKLHENFTNLIAYAYSCYLCKEYRKALDAFDNFKQNKVENYNKKELNDVNLFKLELLIELKEFKLIDEFIESNEVEILDKELLIVLKATADEYQNKFDIAAEKYLQLTILMPDNLTYIDKYVENFKKIYNDKIDNEYKQDLNDNIKNDYNEIFIENQNDNIEFKEIKIQRIIYKCLIKHLPNSIILKQRYLKFANIEEFELETSDYLKMSLKRKIPHAISTFKKVYECDVVGKVEIIEEKLENLIIENKNNPDLLKWCYYYMAVHFKLLDNFTFCMKYLVKAIKIDNKMHDALVFMAKIYQKVQNFECAHIVIKYVADLVPNDRYINSIAGKCFFYINEMNLAEKYMQKFSKSDQSIDSYMRDVQNLWFRVHKATLFNRKKHYFESLYQIRIAECHFEQFSVDRIDFHNYCIRRLLIKPHENMLLQDKSLKTSKFYYLLIKVTAKTLFEIMCLSKNVLNKENNVDSTLTVKQKKQERLKKLKEMKKEQRKNGDILLQSNSQVLNKVKNCCINKHTLETPDKLKDCYMDINNQSKLKVEMLKIADILKKYFNHKFKTQSLLFDIYLILDEHQNLLNCYNEMININSKHYKLFYYEDRLLKYCNYLHLFLRFN